METKVSKPVSDVSIYLRLLNYTKSSWPYFVLSFFGYLLYGAMEPTLAYLLQLIVDTLGNPEAEGARTNLADDRLFLPLFILGIFIIRGTGTFFGSYFMAVIGTKLVFDLRVDMFNKLSELPSSYFHGESSGRILSKLTFNTEQVIGSVTQAVRVMLREGLTVIGLFGFMLYTNWRLSLFFILIIPFIAVIVSYASKRFRKLSKRIQNAMGGITDVASEAIKGQEVVKIFGGKEYEKERFYHAAYHNKRSQLKMELTKSLNVPIVQFIVATALAMIIWLALAPEISENMTAGHFVAFIGAAGMLSKPLRQLTEINSILQKGLAAAQSIFEFLDEESEKDTGKTKVDTLKGKLELKQVSFVYPNTDKKILNKIDLTLPAGKTLALVGRSGGGKSTVANLVPRFYDINDGELLVDGINVKEYALNDLRRNVALVNQKIVLFNASVRENIAYGHLADASDEDIIAAAKAANAWDFIEKLEHGLDTQVGEDGTLFSGGQRQRIAIARAILKDASILILDEATSALDSESERAIQQALNSLMKNRTTIAIAHRLSTIEKADIIAVIDQGQIIEQGSHDELLAKGGAYAKLHGQQFNEEESH
ncbi:lipid A export permease/ATP-binding protein MsbA [Marinomonas sp. S3726]|uniref:lipid A export permease/ATP-binding protein MsbA n=1 Tax=Marinomonas sp. S3726 TaxID=579484 RepID=UPI0005FA376A|nr:lipid A export permease/ATP-binding protein MsbA [Marinomonas sp. S3726]